MLQLLDLNIEVVVLLVDLHILLVFNLNFIRREEINFDLISKLIETINPFEVEEARCEKMDTPFGDFDDITFTKYTKDEKTME